MEVSGPHFIFGKTKVRVSQSRPAGTRKTLPVIACGAQIKSKVIICSVYLNHKILIRKPSVVAKDDTEMQMEIDERGQDEQL